MNEMWEIGCEEVYFEDMASHYIFVKGADLPAATYLGNDEWLGIDGVHYIVMDM